MCLSAPVSFVVGSGIGLIGASSMVKARRSPLMILAVIPIFFMLQQFAEGVVWLYMTPEFVASPVSVAAAASYLFFALVFWPIYLPLAVSVLEKDRTRKFVSLVFLTAGILAAAWNLYFIAIHPVLPIVAGHSLSYGVGSGIERAIYGIIVFVPMSISSVKGMRVLAALGVITFVLSHIVFDAAFTSVWCFSAALLSLYIYRIVSLNSPRDSSS